jgi:hypothetical protein
MKKIFPNLHIGSQDDYENIVKHQDGWFVIHACKEAYHHQALGYTGRSAPKEHSEYLELYPWYNPANVMKLFAMQNWKSI